jgi:DNA-directed RNA polymerase subunit M/transcription elongation factor TFIIS
MIVFRLTDELVRRSEGKRLTPCLPESVVCEWDDAIMSQSCMEWIVRYEAYRAQMAKTLGRGAASFATSEESFNKKIQEAVDEANVKTVEALVQKKRMALVVCKQCKSDDIIKDEKQTKSADEGATGFYLCNQCGYSWKQNG